jgi:hypothetical protein
MKYSSVDCRKIVVENRSKYRKIWENRAKYSKAILRLKPVSFAQVAAREPFFRFVSYELSRRQQGFKSPWGRQQIQGVALSVTPFTFYDYRIFLFYTTIASFKITRIVSIQLGMKQITSFILVD